MNKGMESDDMKKKKVVIVGAGVSGLLACKHCVEQGLSPVVFEAESHVAGVWSTTLESTKLQTPKTHYQFSDFPWPRSLKDTLFPDHAKVVDYLAAYASHFGLLSRINFNAKVNSLDYSHSTATWTVTVHHAHSPSFQVYEADFVILCIGNFSGLANTPEFPANEGPEVFDGLAIHSMDFSAMDDKAASHLLAGKRVVVVGSQKSALDLATEAANLNGAERPCRLVYRTAHWTVPEYLTAFMFRGFSRFSEMMVHRPRESFLRSLSVALFFYPLLWVFSKMVETFLRTVYPLSKYDLVPRYSFVKQMFTWTTPTTPAHFFERLRQGSIVPVKLRSPEKQLRFCKSGLIVDGHNALSADIVVFATGYKPDQKLQNIFSSSYFKECLAASSPPFYRDCIHPRIPKVGIVGYADSSASLFATEMRSKWLAHFLAGKFELPSVAAMEQDSATWEKCTRRYAGADYRRYCAPPLLQIYTNDLLCNDMGINPRRKSCFLADFFEPYTPTDYT